MLTDCSLSRGRIPSLIYNFFQNKIYQISSQWISFLNFFLTEMNPLKQIFYSISNESGTSKKCLKTRLTLSRQSSYLAHDINAKCYWEKIIGCSTSLTTTRADGTSDRGRYNPKPASQHCAFIRWQTSPVRSESKFWSQTKPCTLFLLM